MSALYLIRPIKAKGRFKFYLCGECATRATHYLVRLPSHPMDQRESRSRRCEKHARENAESLRIPFVDAEVRL